MAPRHRSPFGRCIILFVSVLAGYAVLGAILGGIRARRHSQRAAFSRGGIPLPERGEEPMERRPSPWDRNMLVHAANESHNSLDIALVEGHAAIGRGRHSMLEGEREQPSSPDGERDLQTEESRKIQPLPGGATPFGPVSRGDGTPDASPRLQLEQQKPLAREVRSEPLHGLSPAEETQLAVRIVASPVLMADGALLPAAVGVNTSNSSTTVMAIETAQGQVPPDVLGSADARSMPPVKAGGNTTHASAHVANGTETRSAQVLAVANGASSADSWAVTIESLVASCQDHEPFRCAEQGCPSALVGCLVIRDSCQRSFDKVFEHPPHTGMGPLLVHQLCPKTCARCGVSTLTREEVLGVKKRTSTNMSVAGALDGCGLDVNSPSWECTRRSSWQSAIVETTTPVGENTRYRAPTSVSGYRELTDATSWTQLPAADSNGCLRYFTVGTRGDMRGTVRPMLKQLGLCEASQYNRTDFLWEKPWLELGAFFRPDAIAPGSIVNSIAGLSQQVGEKTSLARLHVKCMQRAGYDPLAAIPSSGRFCRFTSRAFAVHKTGSTLQAPYRKFREYNLQLDREVPEDHRIWILKPQGGFNQVGIHMFSLAHSDTASVDATVAWLLQRVPEGTWVLQEYLMNPMTYRGHKFDLRIWAIVTSLDPLRVYLLGTGIPKVSQWVYTKQPKDVKEMCMHVLMPGGLPCFTDKRADVLETYPTRTNVQDWYDNVYPSGKEFWTTRAWPSLEWQLVEMLLLARDGILHADHQIKRHGYRYKRIFFLSPDFVLSTEGQATMVEVNVNGYMIGNLHKKFFPLHEEQRAAFRVMGAHGFPKQKKYMAALQEKTGDFCATRTTGCTKAAEREIWEMVHEDMHCTMSWYRIFPTRDNHEYTARLKQAPAYSGSFTYMDYLMFDWLALGWAPSHVIGANHSIVVKYSEPKAKREARLSMTTALGKGGADIAEKMGIARNGTPAARWRNASKLAVVGLSKRSSRRMLVSSHSR